MKKKRIKLKKDAGLKKWRPAEAPKSYLIALDLYLSERVTAAQREELAACGFESADWSGSDHVVVGCPASADPGTALALALGVLAKANTWPNARAGVAHRIRFGVLFDPRKFAAKKLFLDHAALRSLAESGADLSIAIYMSNGD